MPTLTKTHIDAIERQGCEARSPHGVWLALLIVGLLSLACAEAAPATDDMDTLDMMSDAPVPDVNCGSDTCVLDQTFCSGPYSVVTCVPDDDGCGLLGDPVACSLSELCEAGVCVPFESCLDTDMDGYGAGCPMGEDCDDGNAAVHPGAVEACDMIDNNCVDGTDEGCPDPCAGAPCTISTRRCMGSGLEECIPDAMGCGSWSPPVNCPGGCTAGACIGCVDGDSDGRGVGCPLGDDCDDGNPARYNGNTEICDGVDNNCDNTPDETFADKGDSCSAGMGACQRSGTMVCTADMMGTECDATPGAPMPEQCGDSVDSDCQGDNNNGFEIIGQGCSTGSGSCTSTGTIICDPSDGRMTTCNAPPPSGVPEICDGNDNDCNGTPDNGGVCTNCVDDPLEPNDTSSTGADLTSNKTVSAVSCGPCATHDWDWFLLGNYNVGNNVSIELVHPTGNNGVGAAWADLDVEFYCNSKFCDAIRGTAGTTSGTFNGSCWDSSSCAAGSRWTIHVYPRCNPDNPASGTPYSVRRY